MQVTIEINGRQALPVRAIPLLTDWRGLSPDQLAQILAGESDHWLSFDGLTAHRLHSDGSIEPIPPRWWASWVVDKLQAASDTIKANRISHATGKQQWRSESLAQLPAGVFVWRDEFEAAHAQEYGPEGLRARGNPEGFDPSVHALDLNPQPDPAIVPPQLVLDGFVPISGAINQGRAQALEWSAVLDGKEPPTPVEPPQAVPAESSASTRPDYSVLATRAQLIQAFGAFTGMDLTWFDNLKDTPALLNARKVSGRGGRGHLAEPWFCPFEVMQWLVSARRKKGRPLGLEKAWELLERHFPKAYSAHSAADPRAGD